MDSASYQLTVGLEIHVELKTKTKMFCRSANDPDERRPNVNVCPICLGHPGTLPTINKQAIEHVLRVGLALGGQLANFSEFDRKNYFYPDLPKGYQISQYQHPLVTGGQLNDVAVTRVHLEEDTARFVHAAPGGVSGSLVDFNRAGVPLMELVTEPVIKTAKQAANFAREFQLLLRYLEVSGANMEKGEMRVEANISVAASGARGTKVEIKNLNSFRSVERAIDFELNRQATLLTTGERVIQETRGWDESREITFSQREKESAHDYRYFPDPDLPKLKIGEIEEFKNLPATIPELPWQKRTRYQRDYALKPNDIEGLVSEKRWADFFDQVTNHLKSEKKAGLGQLAANYLLTDLINLLAKPETLAPEPRAFAELVTMIEQNEISSRAAKDILADLVYPQKIQGESTSPRDLAKAKNLFQESDETNLRGVVNQIISKNPKVVADYQNGKKSSLQFLVGQGMKLSGGAANPQILGRLFTEILG
ncbi:MAG: Asp-tRNA(Asn)/Glu-tRNA(Gln) amidotransferase subunit GatB [Patescibacteria group bacterium]